MVGSLIIGILYFLNLSYYFYFLKYLIWTQKYWRKMTYSQNWPTDVQSSVFSSLDSIIRVWHTDGKPDVYFVYISNVYFPSIPVTEGKKRVRVTGRGEA